MSKVSVAMTTYNGADFLLPQLQSLLAQTRLPDEVVICDDKSQDNTVEIVRNFIEKNGLNHWTVLENAENLGYIENYRKAMSLTTGDIVFLCDQDDVWHPKKVETMTGAMESSPTMVALASGYVCIDQLGKRLDVPVKKFYSAPFWSRGGLSISKVRYGRVLYYNMAQGCATAYRRCLVDRYCTAENCDRIPHDWALNMMAYEVDGLFYINEELLSYRLHEHNKVGIETRAGALARRIPRLESYAEDLSNTLLLPLSMTTRQDVQKIMELTRTRVDFLRERRFSVWFEGLARHSFAVLHFFFWQYMKDAAIVLLEKILSARSTDPNI